MKTLDIKEKQNVAYCISNELRDEQIKINITKVRGRLTPATELKNEPIALVSFGPSLNDTWEELKKFKNIMTCSGAYKFLVDKGITPNYHADLEPRAHKIGMLGEPQKETEFLIASTIHPTYLDKLEGYNVKLWHIFANDEEAKRVLPKGEWCLTGGSSIGLRLLTLARFLGYTDMHIFGMDGNIRESQTHTTYHPNAPKEKFIALFEGKRYITTPSMLHVAKETPHELDQLGDVTTTFYGEGLVQEIVRLHKPAPRHKTNIAFSDPELISKEYIELNSKLHKENPAYGMGGSKHTETILKLSKELKTTSILDYGCGKGMLAKSLPFPIWEYDPAIPEKSAIPKAADIVVCTDVLEHIEAEKLQFVLDDLRRVVKQVGYFVISTRKAKKTYANGKNTHNIVEGKDWWNKKLSKFFDIGTIIEKEKEHELHIVVAPKKAAQQDIMVVELGDTKVKFYTPNETTKWRAKTLFSKEPCTVEWINQMSPGDIMFDVGANVGGYSVLAGVRGVKAYAFEPEAENYALLVRNLLLNNLPPTAYCVAISDEEKIGSLQGGQQEAGGACRTFEQKNDSVAQGCFGVTLDKLVERGLPSPHHIKIDIDGLEYNVVKGASSLLANGVKSLLVEVDRRIPQHLKMLETLENHGFTYDKAQVAKAERKEGAFKGVAEYIFTKGKSTGILAQRIVDTAVQTKPFNYIYVEELVPEYIYGQLISSLPEKYMEIEKSRGTKGYPKRFTAELPRNIVWQGVKDLLLGGDFKAALLDKFGIEDEGFTEDLLLIRDEPGYAIPPHTDSTTKVVSALFYLPTEETEEGTSLFVPRKKGFTCKTGKHHKFDDFVKVKTMPFKPNSLFAFARTDNSFHGVEPCSHVRNVLLYNIKTK